MCRQNPPTKHLQELPPRPLLVELLFEPVRFPPQSDSRTLHLPSHRLEALLLLYDANAQPLCLDRPLLVYPRAVLYFRLEKPTPSDERTELGVPTHELRTEKVLLARNELAASPLALCRIFGSVQIRTHPFGIASKRVRTALVRRCAPLERLV